MMARMSARKRNLLVLAGVLVVAAAATATVVAIRYGGMPKRFDVVVRDVLYRSAQPSKRQIDNLIEEHGIKTIVIVRTGESRRVPDEKEHARRRGLNVFHIPIESREPIPADQIRRFFELVDDPANHPILIHCSAGRHRTGLLCAAYRIERQGWTIERAVEELRSFRFDEVDHKALLEQLENYTRLNSTGSEVDSAAGDRP